MRVCTYICVYVCVYIYIYKMHAVYHRILLIGYGDVMRTFLVKNVSSHKGSLKKILSIFQFIKYNYIIICHSCDVETSY